MQKRCLAVILACGLVPTLSGYVRGSDKPAKNESTPLMLKVGDKAPDFSLLAFDGKELKKVALSDYRGKKNVTLAFFVFAFTGG